MSFMSYNDKKFLTFDIFLITLRRKRQIIELLEYYQTILYQSHLYDIISDVSRTLKVYHFSHSLTADVKQRIFPSG